MDTLLNLIEGELREQVTQYVLDNYPTASVQRHTDLIEEKFRAKKYALADRLVDMVMK
jgi:hypothetical protein